MTPEQIEATRIAWVGSASMTITDWQWGYVMGFAIGAFIGWCQAFRRMAKKNRNTTQGTKND